MTNSLQGELSITSENDIVLVRRTAREVAHQAGFGPTDITRLVTASSEMARNIFKYAGQGTMRWRGLEHSGRTGLELRFEDQGPGISNVELAMQEGYSTGNGLGMGLPGSKRLVDEFEIQSATGKGTTVTLRKWLNKWH